MRLSALGLISVLFLWFGLSWAAPPVDEGAKLKQQGMRLYNDATKTAAKAQSKKELSNAAAKYEKALKFFEDAGFKEGTLRVVNNLGVVYFNSGEYQKALESYRKLLELSKQAGDLRSSGAALTNMGATYAALGQYDHAVESLLRSAGMMKKAKFPAGEADSIYNLGTVYLDRGDLPKAEESLDRSLQVMRATGDEKGQGMALNSLGNLLKLRGKYGEAEDAYRRSLEIRKRIGDAQGEAVTMNNMGALFTDFGDHSKAAETYQKVLERKKKPEYGKFEADVLLNMGEALEHKGNHQEALAKYQEALEIYKALGLPIKKPSIVLGAFYLEKGQIEEAEPFVKESGDRGLTGRFYLAKSQPLKAEPIFDELRMNAEKSGDVEDLFTAYTGLGKVYEGLEEFQKARRAYTSAFRMTEEMRSRLLPSERKTFLDVKVKWGFYRSEPAKGLTRVNMKLNNPSQSIESSEVTRARAFTDGIAQRQERGFSGVPQDILKREEELVVRIATLKKTRSGTSQLENHSKYENLSKEIEEAEGQFEVFREMLWKNYKAYASVKYPRPTKLSESAIRSNEYVVVFDVVGEGVGVKLIQGRKILSTFYVNWDLNDLEKQVQEFREPFEQFKLREFDPDKARNLYSKLLAAVLAGIPEGSSVIIIPDGVLAVLPFEALVMSGSPTWKQGAGGQHPEGLTYVADKYSISYYQSITALTLARELGQSDKAGSKVLVVADPVFGLDDPRLERIESDRKKQLAALPTRLMSAETEAGISFPRLPLTKDLGEYLKTLDPGDTDLYMGLDATKSRLFEKPLNGYRSIVFATHGYYGKDIPGIQEPVLALTMIDKSDDDAGFLRMSEVMGLKLSAGVVALTACQTGVGRYAAGEGVMGMGRAFQYAGARSVLMSLWSVAEVSSVRLMESFFRHLKEGRTRLEALKLARLDIRKQGYRHPFFWAPFILVGETE